MNYPNAVDLKGEDLFCQEEKDYIFSSDNIPHDSHDKDTCDDLFQWKWMSYISAREKIEFDVPSQDFASINILPTFSSCWHQASSFFHELSISGVHLGFQLQYQHSILISLWFD